MPPQNWPPRSIAWPKRSSIARASIAPPVNALQLAVRLGYEIAWSQGERGRARIVQTTRSDSLGRGTILLTPEPRLERRQWAVAHELGEAAAYQVFERLDQDPRTVRANVREQVANWLAGRLLIPSRWWHSSGDDADWDLLMLKQRFSTASHELLARRMLEAEPPIVITIFDQGSIFLRMGNHGFARHAGPRTKNAAACNRATKPARSISPARRGSAPGRSTSRSGYGRSYAWIAQTRGWSVFRSPRCKPGSQYGLSVAREPILTRRVSEGERNTNHGGPEKIQSGTEKTLGRARLLPSR